MALLRRINRHAALAVLASLVASACMGESLPCDPPGFDPDPSVTSIADDDPRRQASWLDPDDPLAINFPFEEWTAVRSIDYPGGLPSTARLFGINDNSYLILANAELTAAVVILPQPSRAFDLTSAGWRANEADASSAVLAIALHHPNAVFEDVYAHHLDAEFIDWTCEEDITVLSYEQLDGVNRQFQDPADTVRYSIDGEGRLLRYQVLDPNGAILESWELRATQPGERPDLLGASAGS